ncbi:MAG TPA: hypothetical protein VIQ29_01110, partial [Ancylobacter sp.]
VADITDPALKERIDGLKAIRDQAQADAARAQTSLATSGEDAVTPAMVARFADIARKRMRIEGGGYRRDHLRALAQRVEVGAREVRIIGSKGDLLRTLAAVSGGKSATLGVPSLGLKWRSGRDSNRDRACLLRARPSAGCPLPGVGAPESHDDAQAPPELLPRSLQFQQHTCSQFRFDRRAKYRR